MHVVSEGAHKMFWVKHEADVILHDDLLHKFWNNVQLLPSQKSPGVVYNRTVGLCYLYLSAWRDAGTDEEQRSG